MTDAIKKKSKLEVEIEKSKKRPFSEISGFQNDSSNISEIEPERKKLKFNDSNNFLNDVIIKKSRIEIEKEAALKKQQLEKENQLKTTSQKGLVMIFENNEPRSSKSPPVCYKGRASQFPK